MSDEYDGAGEALYTEADVRAAAELARAQASEVYRVALRVGALGGLSADVVLKALEPAPMPAAQPADDSEGEYTTDEIVAAALELADSDEHPAGALEALAEKLHVGKAWDESKHKRDHGKFSSTGGSGAGSDAKTAGGNKPGKRALKAQKRAEAVQAASALMAQRAKGKPLSHGEAKELLDHMAHLTHDDLRALRKEHGSTFRGERVKGSRVDALVKWARGEDYTRRRGKRGSALQQVVDYGGLDPNSADFKRFYGSMRDAVNDGVPMAAFKRGGQGLDELAAEMVAAGHISIPDWEDPAEHLVGLLRGRKLLHHAADEGHEGRYAGHVAGQLEGDDGSATFDPNKEWDDEDPDWFSKAAPLPDDDTHTPAELLAAAVDVAQRALADGTDPEDGLHALYELAHGDTVQKAWDKDKHPRDDHGRFVSKDAIQAAKSDPKKAAELKKRVTNPEQRKKLDAALEDKEVIGTKRGLAKHETAQKREKVQADRNRARELRIKLADQESRGEELNPDDLREIVPHLATMTHEELSRMRSMLERSGATFGGKRLRADRVAALTQWALDKAAGKTDAPAPEVNSGIDSGLYDSKNAANSSDSAQKESSNADESSGSYTTPAEALINGVPYNKWHEAVFNAAYSEEDGSVKDPKAVELLRSVNEQQYRRHLEVVGKPVVVNHREVGAVEGFTDDLMGARVRMADGSVRLLSPDSLWSVGGTVRHELEKGRHARIHPEVMNHFAGRIADEMLSTGANLSDTLRKHNIDPTKAVSIRGAIAEEYERRKEAQKPQPSEALQRARERAKQLEDAPQKEVDPLHEEDVQRGRDADKKFRGEGRYEAETWQKLRRKNPDARLPKLSKNAAEWIADDYDRDGKPVPAEVLADYPDLAAKYAKPDAGTSAAPVPAAAQGESPAPEKPEAESGTSAGVPSDEDILHRALSPAGSRIEDTEHPRYQQIVQAAERAQKEVLARMGAVSKRFRELMDPDGSLGIADSGASASYHIAQAVRGARAGNPLGSRGVIGDESGKLLPVARGMNAEKPTGAVSARARKLAAKLGTPIIPLLVKGDNDEPKGWAFVQSPVEFPNGVEFANTIPAGVIDTGDMMFSIAALPKDYRNGMMMPFDSNLDFGTMQLARKYATPEPTTGTAAAQGESEVEDESPANATHRAAFNLDVPPETVTDPKRLRAYMDSKDAYDRGSASTHLGVAYRDHIEDGEYAEADRLRQTVLASGHFIPVGGERGETVPFDGNLHRPLPGTKPLPGDAVRVVHPGFGMKTDVGHFESAKGFVESVTGTAAAQGKPPKTRLQAQAERARAANPPPDPNQEFETPVDQYRAFLRYAHPDDPAQKPDPGAVAEYLSRLPDGAREKLDQHFAKAGKSLAQVEAFHRARMAEATPERLPPAQEQPAAVPQVSKQRESHPWELPVPKEGESRTDYVKRLDANNPRAQKRPVALTDADVEQLRSDVDQARRDFKPRDGSPPIKFKVRRNRNGSVVVTKDGGSWEASTLTPDESNYLRRFFRARGYVDATTANHFGPVDFASGTGFTLLKDPAGSHPLFEGEAEYRKQRNRGIPGTWQENVKPSETPKGDIPTGGVAGSVPEGAVPMAPTGNGLEWTAATGTTAAKPELVPGGAPKAPDVSALKRNPRADLDHIERLKGQYPEGAIEREWLDVAKGNAAGVATRDNSALAAQHGGDKQHGARHFVLERLASAAAQAHTDGDAAGHKATTDAVTGLGGTLHGAAPGETIAHDPAMYDHPEGAFTGTPARVVRQPVTYRGALVYRGQVEPVGTGAQPPTNASGTAAATDLDTGTRAANTTPTQAGGANVNATSGGGAEPPKVPPVASGAGDAEKPVDLRNDDEARFQASRVWGDQVRAAADKARAGGAEFSALDSSAGSNLGGTGLSVHDLLSPGRFFAMHVNKHGTAPTAELLDRAVQAAIAKTAEVRAAKEAQKQAQAADDLKANRVRSIPAYRNNLVREHRGRLVKRDGDWHAEFPTAAARSEYLAAARAADAAHQAKRRPAYNQSEAESERELREHSYSPSAEKQQAEAYFGRLKNHFQTAAAVDVVDGLPQQYVGDDTYIPAKPVRGHDGIFEVGDSAGRGTVTYYRRRADGKYERLPPFGG